MKSLFKLFTGALLFSLSLAFASQASALTADRTGDLGGPNYSNYFADEVLVDISSSGVYQKSKDAQETSISSQFVLKNGIDEALYLGFSQPFDGISLDFDTGSTGGMHAIEYWDGSTWRTLVNQSASNLENSSYYGVYHRYWDRPSNWNRQSLSMDYPENGSSSATGNLYFVRLRITSDYANTMVLNQAGITVYNLELTLKTELGETLSASLDDFELSGSGNKNLYQYQQDGNTHKFALNAGSSTVFSYKASVDGYVEADGKSTVKKSSTQGQLIFDYSHKVQAISPLGNDAAIHSAIGGKQDTECSIQAGDAYCAIKLADDNWAVKAYSETYPYKSTSLTDRSKHSDSQKQLSLEFIYPYLIFVKDAETGDYITYAEVKTGDNLQIDCPYIGANEHACTTSLNETEGKLMVRKEGYHDKEDTLDTVRSEITDGQYIQTLYLSPITEEEEEDQQNNGRPDLTAEDLRLDSNGDLRFAILNRGEGDVEENARINITLYVDGEKRWETEISNHDGQLNKGGVIDYETDRYWNDTSEHSVEICVDTKDNVDEIYEDNNCDAETLSHNEDDDERDKNNTNDDRPMADEADEDIDCTSSFRDTAEHWAEKAICILEVEGAVSGRANGFFHPNARITRAEFLKLMMLSMDYNVTRMHSADFSDVSPDSWYYEIVNYAYRMKLVNGYEDGSFKPNKAITRAEAVTVMMRIAGQENWTYTNVDIPFADVKVWDWYAYAVVIAYEDGIMQGYDGNLFRGDGYLTRAEAAVLARRIDYAYNN